MPFILGISGPTNAGKTYFTSELKKNCDSNDIPYSTISTDDFYLDLKNINIEERKKRNYDIPSSISKDDLLNALNNLRNNKSVKINHYSFEKHIRTEQFKIVKPTELIIIEGIFSFSFEEINPIYDLKIYVDLDSDLRLIRRLQRDAIERGRTMENIINQYLDTIKPTQEQYVKKDKSLADIILLGDHDHSKVIKLICDHIKFNR